MEAGYSREKCACGYTRNEVSIPTSGKHTFNKKLVEAKYLKSEATCSVAAVYYMSCVCGEKGSNSDTFTDGEPNPNNHKLDAADQCTICGKIGSSCGDNLSWVLEDDTLTAEEILSLVQKHSGT